MAFLYFVNAGGKTYVYVNKYVGKQTYTSSKEETVARLGRADKALMTLKIWQMDKKKIPKEIDQESYVRIPEWIQQVRNRVAF